MNGGVFKAHPNTSTPTTNHQPPTTNHHHDLPHDGERITCFGSRRHHHSVPAWSARQILRRRFVRDANSSHAVRCILKRGKRKRERREHTQREREHTQRGRERENTQRKRGRIQRHREKISTVDGVTVSRCHVATFLPIHIRWRERTPLKWVAEQPLCRRRCCCCCCCRRWWWCSPGHGRDPPPTCRECTLWQ